MPSGHTAKIAEGMTFPEFALQCATSFMRYEDAQGRPTLADDPSVREQHFYADMLLEKKAELKTFEGLSNDEIRAEYEKSVTESTEYRAKQRKEKNELREKYTAILAQVDAWVPPSETHRNFKKFMIDQLQSSIDWDCNTEYDDREDSKPVEPLNVWYRNRVTSMKRDVEHYTEKAAKEHQNIEEQLRWVKDLRDSLK